MNLFEFTSTQPINIASIDRRLVVGAAGAISRVVRRVFVNKCTETITRRHHYSTIFAPDKTQLTRLSGDKQAWPVYLAIGNISIDVRQKPSQRATVFLGYIPVCKCFTKQRCSNDYKLFRKCVRILLEPMVAARKNGVDMVRGDGWLRTHSQSNCRSLHHRFS